MYAPTAKGVNCAFWRDTPQMTDKRPKVAMNSLKSCDAPERTCSDAANTGSPNMACAIATPPTAPSNCATT